MKVRSILLSLALALVAAPMAGAYHPHSRYIQSEAVHGYFGPGGSDRLVWDGHEVATTIYDGDTENGLGVGRFVVSTPDATYGCTLRPPTVPHHTATAFWALDFHASIVYTAGSDGADATSMLGGCTSNGIISDNSITDPNDCGSGEMGIYDPPTKTWRPATVELGPGCGSFDGYVWVFIASGAFVIGTDTFTSTAVQGHIANFKM